MDNGIIAQIIAIIAAIVGVGGIASLIKARSEAGRITSEARRIDIDALCQAMTTMQARLDKVQDRLAIVERERSELLSLVEKQADKIERQADKIDRQAGRIVDLENELETVKQRLRKYETTNAI